LIPIMRALSAFFLRLLRRLRRGGPGSEPSPEDCLLEEAGVVEPLAPGMTGRVELHKTGLVVRARAQDPSQAFASGARVRLIDYRDGIYFVEPSDREHLVH
jgi:hypothetical protein